MKVPRFQPFNRYFQAIIQDFETRLEECLNVTEGGATAETSSVTTPMKAPTSRPPRKATKAAGAAAKGGKKAPTGGRKKAVVASSSDESDTSDSDFENQPPAARRKKPAAAPSTPRTPVIQSTPQPTRSSARNTSRRETSKVILESESSGISQ